MSTLSSADRKLVAQAREAGLALEKSLSSVSAGARLIEARFRDALATCGASGESMPVRKLGELADKVDTQLGPRHLMALLVPIERLNGRTARDEEFLYFETDGDSPTAQSAASESKVRMRDDSQAVRIVVCENLRSAFNVGAIYRTAETFAAQAVWLSGYSPDPQKTAMGADALVATQRFDRSADFIAAAKAQGLAIVAVENAPGAISLDEFSWPERAVVVLGNERFGLDSQTLAEADHVVRIATMGQKNSLNVGVAFGVIASRWHSRATEPVVGRRTIEPIGLLEGGFATPQTAPRQGTLTCEPARARIRLNPRFEGRPSNFKQALQDLDGFERAWLVFGFDRSQGWIPVVRPPRGDGTKRGVFATRAPHRPNGLGLTAVRILKVNDLELEIEGHDLLIGTPIYDIKPYVAGADAFPEVKQGWLDGIDEFRYQIEESDAFTNSLQALSAPDRDSLRQFVAEQLSFQPLDDSRKRVEARSDAVDQHTIAYQNWCIDFSLDESARTIRVADVRQFDG